jgi:hypothetical protein
MAATVQIVGYYGAAPGTKTALTVQRYNTQIPSTRDPGLAYPNNIPPTGETYRSCWMFTGLEITGGTYSQLTNFRWGTPGTIKDAAPVGWGLGSGMVQVALKDTGDHGCPVASYAAPTGVSGSYGYDIKDADHGVAYYKDETVACADADNYTTVSPLTFDSTVYTPESVLKVTKLVCHQLVLEDDTTFGEKSELQTFIRWQEI